MRKFKEIITENTCKLSEELCKCNDCRKLMDLPIVIKIITLPLWWPYVVIKYFKVGFDCTQETLKRY